MAEEKLEFTPRLLILGNLGLLAWILLSFAALFFYTPLYSWIYLIVMAALIYAILRRLGCNSCYKCKTCTSGFGRLSGIFFGKGLLKKESTGNRLPIILFLYICLVPFPITGLGLSLIGAFSISKLFVLTALLTFTIYSLSTWLRLPSKK